MADMPAKHTDHNLGADLRVKSVGTKRKAGEGGSDDDDVDWLGAVVHAPTKKARPGGTQAEGGESQKRARKTDSSGLHRNKGLKTEPPETPPSNVPNSQASQAFKDGLKQYNAVVDAESLVQEARKLINTAGSDTGIWTLNDTTMKGMLDKLNRKQKNDAIKLLSTQSTGFTMQDREHDSVIDAVALLNRGVN